MFSNIGGKIKTTAKVVCWLGILAAAIVAIACWANGNPQDDGFGFGYLIGGSLASWIGSFLIYGFGELIDRTISIDNKLKNAPVPEQTSETRKTVSTVKAPATQFPYSDADELIKKLFFNLLSPE